MTRSKVAVAVAGLALAAAGGSIAAVTLSAGSGPSRPVVQVVAPSGATASTTTTAPTTTTVLPPPMTVAPSTTEVTPTTRPTSDGLTAPATTTTTVADVIVPNVVGDTCSEAQAALQAAGLVADDGGSCPSGAIITSQQPPAGTAFLRGYFVHIYTN